VQNSPCEVQIYFKKEASGCPLEADLTKGQLQKICHLRANDTITIPPQIVWKTSILELCLRSVELKSRVADKSHELQNYPREVQNSPCEVQIYFKKEASGCPPEADRTERQPTENVSFAMQMTLLYTYDKLCGKRGYLN